MGIFDSVPHLMVWTVALVAWLWCWTAMDVGVPVWLRHLLPPATVEFHHPLQTTPAVADVPVLNKDIGHHHRHEPAAEPPTLLTHPREEEEEEESDGEDPQHNINVLFLNYPTMTFNTGGNVTKGDYKQFLKNIREHVVNPGDTRHGIPVLRNPSTVPDNQRFLLVQLTNHEGNSATLAIDITNMYVVAYRVGTQSFFFRDAPEAATNLFTDTQQSTLNYTSSYGQLLTYAHLHELTDINVGIRELDASVDALIEHSGLHVDQTVVARSIITCIMMISEAVRFRYVEQYVAQTIRPGDYGSILPNAAIARLVRRWDRLSQGIQRSDEDGVFPRSVDLQRPDYTHFQVTNVMPDIVAIMGIMMFVCQKPQTSRSSPTLVIRPPPLATHDNYTCQDLEPTVRIIGRNALCADVNDGSFYNRDPIILRPCKSDAVANQLWTLKRDGTIRSNGKCLTANGYSPGSYVMIFDCVDAVPDATRWEMWDNGTITNLGSELVLSAELGTSGTRLTVEPNSKSSRQGWLATNSSEPFVSSIVGFKDFCLQANGNDVLLQKCVNDKAEQDWALFPDRSIRPHQNRDLCLSCDVDESEELNVVSIRSCIAASSGQHWIFTNNGNILNSYTRLVMDVRRSDKIIMSSPTGKPSQKWLPLF
ncbi:ricin-like [Malania oleifera]|uniref:ricin-like n=1 Tax=Malania oleifera TaxID=397392 RepID=UPI0025AE03E8|nr:ricin-like [Malania oleifera]